MKIYFCDLCNESVPQADLDRGMAFLRKGRVVCASCDSAMSGDLHDPAPKTSSDAADAGQDAPKDGATATEQAAEQKSADTPATAPTPARSGSGSAAGAAVGVALGSVALLMTVGATVLVFDQFKEQERRHELKLENTRRSLSQLERDFDTRLAIRMDEVRAQQASGANELVGLRARMEESAASQSKELTRLREDLLGVAEEMNRLGELGPDIERHGSEIATVARTAADLHAELLRLGDRVMDIEATGERLLAQAPVPQPEDVRPDWWPHVEQLASQNSGDRWTAVQNLGDTGDPLVCEFLTPMLKDPDIFVRMATARILGDLEAAVGIPALIDALEDPEASVREAAVVSLRAVTGRDFRFDPTGKEAERAKRVKAWRDWWSKVADSMLGGGNAESM